jgi:hypothetical protein
MRLADVRKCSKNAFTLGRSDYHRQYEPILYGWPKGSDHYWCGARNQGDVSEVRNNVSSGSPNEGMLPQLHTGRQSAP